MSDSVDSTLCNDPAFQAVLVSCIEALQRGETIDRERLISDHPVYAEAIQQFLDDQVLLEQATLQFTPDRSSQGSRDNVQATAAGFTLPTLAAGDTVRYIGDYEILGEIARGGMGVVFKAKQRTLHRIVALKMILVGKLASEADVERFRREARAAGRLQHPNIVPIHEVGEYEGHHYFTMDFVEGGSLAELVREETLAPRHAAEILSKVADAVAYAHKNGTLHRDLKPANILVDGEGSPRITDFGLAKLLEVADEDGHEELTASGQVLGTPSYMSPEQASGKSALIGPASDIYSLGAILYSCIAGRAPFVSESTVDTLMQVIKKEPVAPRVLNPSVPKDLETICLKCLTKEPHKRYGTAQQMADDLRRYLEGRPVLARPIGPLEKATLWCKRNRVAALSLAAIGVSLVCGSGISTYYAIEAQRRAKSEAIAKARQVELTKAAEQARDEAEASAILASQRQAEAETARRAEASARASEAAKHREAEKALKHTAWHLYRAELFAHQRAWEEQEFGHLWRLLKRTKPTDGEFDFRGWEWGFFNHELERRFATIEPSSAQYVKAQWSPDGAFLALRREDQQIEIWTADGLKLLNTIPGGTGLDFAWHPLQPVIASANRDASATSWDVVSGRKITSYLSAEVDEVQMNKRGITWDADGGRLALGGHGRVDLWRVNGEHLATLRSCRTWITNLDWHPDGNQLGIGGASIAGVIDIAADRLLWTGYQHRVPVTDVEWSPSGDYLAAGWGYPRYAVRIYDAQGEVADLPRTMRAPRAISWIDDGTKIYSGNDQAVHLWDVETRTHGRTLRLHSAGIASLDYDHVGNRGVSVDITGLVRVWRGSEASSSELDMKVPLVGSRGWWIDWSCQEDILACGSAGAIHICDASKGTIQHTLNADGKGFTALDWHPTKRWLATQEHSGRVAVWDADTGEEMASLQGSSWDFCYSVAWSPNGRYLAAGSGQKWYNDGQGCFDIWDYETGEIWKSLGDRQTRAVIAWSPDSKSIAVSGYSNRRVAIWDLARQEQIALTPSLDAAVERLTYSNDGRHLAAASNAGIIFLLDSESAEPLVRLMGHSGAIGSVDWAPNGRRIATCSGDGTLRLWNAATAEELVVIGRESPVGFAASWSPTGRRIATFSETGQVQIWSCGSKRLDEGRDNIDGVLQSQKQVATIGGRDSE